MKAMLLEPNGRGGDKTYKILKPPEVIRPRYSDLLLALSVG